MLDKWIEQLELGNCIPEPELKKLCIQVSRTSDALFVSSAHPHDGFAAVITMLVDCLKFACGVGCLADRKKCMNQLVLLPAPSPCAPVPPDASLAE